MLLIEYFFIHSLLLNLINDSQIVIIMKKSTLLFFLSFCVLISTYAQTKAHEKAYQLLNTQGELTFSFKVKNAKDVISQTQNMSFVYFDEETSIVTAWANARQFTEFLKKGIPFTVDDLENDLTPRLMTNQLPSSANKMSTLTFPLTAYPTYADYAQQMQDFENDYPALVDMFSIGTTGDGDKELLFVKISDNVNVDESEPRLMLTSSMHGDEIAGYPMMLNLIDYILNAYTNTSHTDHQRVKNLVEHAEIWINPSANPDGTYNNDATNTSVAFARRGNGNNVDLNRNYPDNLGGAHTDGEVYQAETLAFMNMAQNNKFVIAANFHGGIELVNYPWDNTYDRHPDDAWYIEVCGEYRDNAQNDGPAGYMDDENNGITHGADWYLVYGGRQDYMNHDHNCKEVTVELSNTKKPAASQLVNFWNYNRNALLDFLTQGTYGFKGIVEDAIGTPVPATIKIVNHDALGSWATTDTNGDFYRPIKAGTYDIIIQADADCYQNVVFQNQTITDKQTIDLGTIVLNSGAAVPTIQEPTVGSNNATIDWFEIPNNTFDLRYRETGATTWTNINGLTSNTYNITGLAVGVEYEVQVRSICTNSNTSSYSSSKVFTTVVSYCSSNGADITDEHINRVELNTIDNNNSGASTGGYGDFTTLSTDLTVDSQYTISITPEWTPTTYAEGYSVWIDYNRDGDFLDASEQVFTQSATTDPQVSGNFTIPSGTTAGPTRMRVSMQYNTIPASCGTLNYGEVEDYTVNIVIGTLGVTESTIENISIYPNPFNNSIQVKLPLAFQNIETKIFDMSGRIVHSQRINNNSNTTLNISNLNTLSNGTYLLKIIDLESKKAVIKKIIK